MASAAALSLSTHDSLIPLTHAGDYDYDESNELPAGCEYADEQTANMTGVLNLLSAPGQAGAPAAAPASIPDHASPDVPDITTLAASQQGARLRSTNSSLDGSQAQVQILCRPVRVRRADSGQGTAELQQSSGCGDLELKGPDGKIKSVNFDTFSLMLLIFEVINTGVVIGTLYATQLFLACHRCDGNRGVVGGGSADGGGCDGDKAGGRTGGGGGSGG